MSTNKKNIAEDFPHKLVPVPDVTPGSRIHPGGQKKLMEALDDFQLTMQHALRQNLRAELERMANADTVILPPMTAAEQFDYLYDSDSEFLNFCFPYCAVTLTPENLGYLHSHILKQFRASLEPEQKTD